MTSCVKSLLPSQRFAVLASLCFTVFANANAQGNDGTQQAKPLSASTAATRTTMEALSGAISGSFLGGFSAFRMQLGQHDGLPERGMSAAASESAWSVWATPVYSNINNRIEPLLTEGSVSLILAGLEYAYDEFTVMGVSVTRDWASVTSIERVPPVADRRSAVTGLGYTIAPYFAHQLGPEWLIDLSVGKGVNELKSTQADQSVARPNDARSFASLGATYFKPLNRGTIFTGKITASVTRDAIDDFVSTLPSGASTPVAGSDARLRQFKIGGQLSQQIGSFAPFFGAYGMANDFTVSTDAPIKPREYSRVVQWVAGVNASSGPFYGALALQRERDRNHARIYFGFRY
ncbi:MAG: hypothetical protein EBU79_00010 [Betaproteobacteria bacterium]|nr:hypothetical protein [Betaproteobacteria bacterium]